MHRLGAKILDCHVVSLLAMTVIVMNIRRRKLKGTKSPQKVWSTKIDPTSGVFCLFC